MEYTEIEDILIDIGLEKEEVMIYLKLLESGSTLASKISEITKINRSFTYQLLERLIIKGFVTYVIRENRKYFSAVKPEKLLEIIKDRENRLNTILPKLLSLTVTEKEKPIVEIYEGKEGIKTILNDILKERKEWLGFGSSGKGQEILSYYAEHWEKEREKLKINLKAIIDCSESGKKRGNELSKRKYTQIRYVNEQYSNPTSTWIYSDRIVFVLWDKERSFAIRIKSKYISNNYKKHFEVLWKNSKK